jgi:hypothetical protein
MKRRFEGVKRAPSKDGVVLIGHINHVEGYVLSAAI